MSLSSVGSRPPTPMEAGASQDLDSTLTPNLPQDPTSKSLGEPSGLHLDGAEPSARTGADILDEVPDVDGEQELEREEESFALAPIDASALKGVTKTKRKRKLIVDEVKNISGEEMKSQLANTADIITTLDLAPPTKRLMFWKETGGVEKLFALPSRDIAARGLFKVCILFGLFYCCPFAHAKKYVVNNQICT